MNELVRRHWQAIFADPARVISKPFDPGHESFTPGTSRAQNIVNKVLALSGHEVSKVLAEIIASYATRHDDLRAAFRRNFRIVVRDGAANHQEFTQDQIDLLGAYFTQEYAIEGAALFNPSIVEAPDQSGCPTGSVRFVMSLRAVGEGHLSCIEFRTGYVSENDYVMLDPASPHLSTGDRSHVPSARDFHAPPAPADHAQQEIVTPEFPPPTTMHLADASYQLTFPATSTLSERVLFPGSEAESHGLEDCRMVRFVDDDGSVVYYGTYTAYDGAHIAPHMFRTEDFQTYVMRPMRGPAAVNKGLALFPRRINGHFWTLSRWDRENISVARFDLEVGWGDARTVQAPSQPWQFVQMGSCSSPMETAAGWLVLTHGVGPMRSYYIGALLLDLNDPTKVIGALDDPLLLPSDAEREGYVPNVLYSCGALIHKDSLVLPYGCSDSSVRFAFIDLPGLLARLRSGSQQSEEHITSMVAI